MALFNQWLEDKSLKAAIDEMFYEMNKANLLLNEKAPWKLFKVDPESAKQVFARLLLHLETIAKMSEILLPETVPKMWKMIGDGEKEVGKAEILFQRVE